MKKIYPQKLQSGDEIRVISPSSSLEKVGGMQANLIAKERLERLGFKVTFGDHIYENDQLFSASIAARVADLHDAFRDKQVKAVMTTIGGFNANELLPYIDWSLIKNNPKFFFGYSDTTSLHTAIFAKTGLVTYYSPAYSSFKMDALQDFQTSQWLKSVSDRQEGARYDLEENDVYTSDPWYDTSIPRNFLPNKWQVYNEGHATGTIIGGNIQTYHLLFGTPYFRKIVQPIGFLEEAEEGDAYEFDRLLAQFLQVNPDVKGLVIGRFPKECGMTHNLLLYILDKYPILKQIPVIYDVDFGHTQPIFTFPLGGEVAIDTKTLQITVYEK
ncbi:MAG: S66 family peptidase [Weissella hellenica]|uniref:S66 family peptidase n=1 Tax=Weissella hellenica TaxID=46256 RepID=UPI003F95859C